VTGRGQETQDCRHFRLRQGAGAIGLVGNDYPHRLDSLRSQ
jgi:hypothetical protein